MKTIIIRTFFIFGRTESLRRIRRSMAAICCGMCVSLLATYAGATQPGAADTTFAPGNALGTNFSRIVHAVLAQPNGRILVGGQFSTANGAAGNNIARLNTDGTVGASFSASVTKQGGFANVEALALEGGQILIGGTFDSVNGYARNGLARLNQDGTLDTNFNPNLGSFPEIELILVQADGKIIVGGSISIFLGNDFRNYVVRLTSDGAIDLSFDIGFQGVGGFVYAGAVQPDGKVILGGFFSGVLGRTNLARFEASGALDTNYWPKLDTFGTIHSIALQADGKAVIAGEFNNVSGVTRYGFARVNTDGTLDGTFSLHDAGTNRFSDGGKLTTALVQPDQKILLGGMYMPATGGIKYQVERFLNDGTPDPGYVPVSADSSIEAITLQYDGKIYAGGEFSTFGGAAFRGIARLGGDDLRIDHPHLTLRNISNGLTCLTFPTQPGCHYSLDASSDLHSWSELTNVFATAWLTQNVDATSDTVATRFYRVRYVR